MSSSTNGARPKTSANSDTAKVSREGNEEEYSRTSTSSADGKTSPTESKDSAKRSTTTSAEGSRPPVIRSHRSPSSHQCNYKSSSEDWATLPDDVLDSLIHSQHLFPVERSDTEPSATSSEQPEPRPSYQEHVDSGSTEPYVLPSRYSSQEVIDYVLKSQFPTSTPKPNSTNKQPTSSLTQGRKPSEPEFIFKGHSQNNAFDFTTVPKCSFPGELLGPLFQSINNSATTRDSTTNTTRTFGGKNWYISYSHELDKRFPQLRMGSSSSGLLRPHTIPTPPAMKTTHGNRCERKGSRSKFGDSKSINCESKRSLSKVSKPMKKTIDNCERKVSRSKIRVLHPDVALEIGSRGAVKKSKQIQNKTNPSEPIRVPIPLNSKIFSRGAILDQDAIEVIQIEDEDVSLALDQSPSCRICHDDMDEPLISPCRCKGTIGHVHHTCLSTWLSQDYTHSFICELCQYPYPVVEARRYTMLESIPVWAQDPENRERFWSFMYVSGFITVINLVVYIVAVLVMRYTALHNAPDWFLACMFLFLVVLYLWNMVQSFKDTIYNHWYRWWKTSMQVCLDLDAMVQKTRLDSKQEQYSSHHSIHACNHI